MGCTSFVEVVTRMAMMAPMTAVEMTVVAVVAVAVEAACVGVLRGSQGVVMMLATVGLLAAAVVVMTPTVRAIWEAGGVATVSGMAAWRVGARTLGGVTASAQPA